MSLSIKEKKIPNAFSQNALVHKPLLWELCTFKNGRSLLLYISLSDLITGVRKTIIH